MNTVENHHKLLLLNRISEFHNLQLSAFLTVIFEMETPMPRSEEFEVQLWIKQYLEESVSNLAKSVWNKFYSSINSIRTTEENRKRINLFCKYGLDSFQSIDHFTVAAFVDAINAQNTAYNTHSEKPNLLSDYIDCIHEVVQDCLDTRTADKQKLFFAKVIEGTANLVKPSQLAKLFDFIVFEGCLNQDQDVAAAFEKTGIEVCINVCHSQGASYSKIILEILSGFLSQPEKHRTSLDDKQKNTVFVESLTLIASLAKFFDENDVATLDIYERIVEMLNLPSKPLKKAISKCISPLSKLMPARSKKLMKQLLDMLSKSNDANTLVGAAFAVAGIVKGLGKNLIKFAKIKY